MGVTRAMGLCALSALGVTSCAAIAGLDSYDVVDCVGVCADASITNDGGIDVVVIEDALAPSDTATVEDQSSETLSPSHVSATFDPAALDLQGVTEIDTTARTVKAGTIVLADIRFEAKDGFAVLFVGKWNVASKVTITGSSPLVVLATGNVTISAAIDASAKGVVPGPGGAPPASGQGAGANAVGQQIDDPGGGGAGFGTTGATGGNGAGTTGGAGGNVYGTIADLFGGSGGGRGSPFGVAPCNAGGNGGAGGGAIQITSQTSIAIAAAGSVAAGGGGGLGGCLNGQNSSMSGAGGGSGGTIFLEAPSIDVKGVVAANGGGGGGGASINVGKAGKDGADALVSGASATGGDGASSDRNGGAGGSLQGPPIRPGGSVNNAGGGGGAVGRIFLRTRGVAASKASSSTISPAALSDTTL